MTPREAVWFFHDHIDHLAEVGAWEREQAIDAIAALSIVIDADIKKHIEYLVNELIDNEEGEAENWMSFARTGNDEERKSRMERVRIHREEADRLREKYDSKHGLCEWCEQRTCDCKERMSCELAGRFGHYSCGTQTCGCPNFQKGICKHA